MNQLVTLTASNNALPLISAAGDRAAYRFLEYSSPWAPLLAVQRTSPNEQDTPRTDFRTDDGTGLKGPDLQPEWRL